MNVVGIRTDNSKVFESIPINESIETAISDAETAILNDAETAGIEVSISQMISEELISYIASH